LHRADWGESAQSCGEKRGSSQGGEQTRQGGKKATVQLSSARGGIGRVGVLAQENLESRSYGRNQEKNTVKKKKEKGPIRRGSPEFTETGRTTGRQIEIKKWTKGKGKNCVVAAKNL